MTVCTSSVGVVFTFFAVYMKIYSVFNDILEFLF